MVLHLNQREVAILFRQDSHTAHRGGFQWLLIQLQSRTKVSSGRIFLVSRDLERIRRYAFDYGNGGWEKRLTLIFGRCLGPDLRGPVLRAKSQSVPLAA